MTAADLARELARYGLAVTADGSGIGYDGDCPARLDAAAGVLSTGVMAVLTGRRWFGCRRTTGAVEVLSPTARIPAGVTLLAVEGGAVWDRIPADSWLDLPHLFAAHAEPAPTRGRKSPHAPANRPPARVPR